MDISFLYLDECSMVNSVGDYLGEIEGTIFEFNYANCKRCSECETILDRILLSFFFVLLQVTVK